MMIRAIALDDEPPALNVIKRFCERIEFLELVQTFTKAEEASAFLSSNPVDMIFLDINMPAITGIEFKKKLPASILVIFTTAYSEFALEGFDLQAVDYLLKPFTYNRFRQAAEKARIHYKGLQQEAPLRPDHIILRVDYSLVKVELAGILFIEGLDDYLKIHLVNRKPIVVRMTMKAIAESLPGNDFVRVHRSYIVAFKKVDAVRNKVIYIGDEVIPVGASFESRLYELLGRQAN